MREERLIAASIAIDGVRPATYNETLAVNADVIGGVRYLIIESRVVKVLLPFDSALELALRLQDAAGLVSPEEASDQ